MQTIENPDDADNKAVPVRLGFTIGTYTPDFLVPHEVAREMRETGDIDEAVRIVAEWWDDMTTEERAEAMGLAEKDGSVLAENIIFADVYDKEREGFEPVFES